MNVTTDLNIITPKKLLGNLMMSLNLSCIPKRIPIHPSPKSTRGVSESRILESRKLRNVGPIKRPRKIYRNSEKMIGEKCFRVPVSVYVRLYPTRDKITIIARTNISFISKNPKWVCWNQKEGKSGYEFSPALGKMNFYLPITTLIVITKHLPREITNPFINLQNISLLRSSANGLDNLYL